MSQANRLLRCWTPHVRRLIAAVAFGVLCVVYVLPHHPSAGRDAPLDVLVHIAFFIACGVGLVWTFGQSRVPLIVLAVLALALEVIQWRVAGFPHIEWRDVASNETGVLMAWAASAGWRRMRWGGHGGD